MHLDGARIWNAMVATGVPAQEWGEHVRHRRGLLQQGAGHPVGSMLPGPKDLIEQARRIRKLFGGAMRQAGFLAAACLYALDHHIERTRRGPRQRPDHRPGGRGRAGAHGSSRRDVETNLVWFEVDARLGTAKDVAERLKANGVLVAALGQNVIRAVTHLDVSREQCQTAATAIRKLAG